MEGSNRVAAVAAAASSKREPDALKVPTEELESKVMHLHNEVDIVKQLRSKVARLGHDVENMSASLTDTGNMRDEAVNRADNLSVYFAVSVYCRDAYKLELAVVKKGLKKTRVERASLG